MSDQSDFEARLERLIHDDITRRRLLKRGAGGALSLSAIAWLAACGDDNLGGGEKKQSKVIPKGKIASSLYFANWPLYIDSKSPDKGTFGKFKDEYGTRVKYVEEINDNDEFFGKVRQQYARGDSGGRDLHAVTDWMAARMIRLGYVQKLDKSQLPNVQANLLDALKHPDYDKNRDYGVPWQGIQAGIIYRKDKVKREPKSVNDIFDPAYKGKTTMLTEMRDSVGLVMLGMGKDPETGSLDDMLAAVEKIDKASRSGQIRRFTGNEYTKDITKGDSWLIYGWSGDAVSLQADNPNIAFVAPEEGFILSYDIMQIPVGAPHAFTAEKMIDFVYQPEIQAPIAEFVNYVTPVKGVKEILAKKDPKLASSQLIFPSDETLKRAKIFRTLKPDEERKLTTAFQKVIGA
ncbi:MAG: spermidine/putrescine ABC transporter substrate-binding protein [Actinomycetota bacterium]